MHAAAVFEQENSEFEHWREFSVCARALSGSIRWLENLNGGNNWEGVAGRQEMTLKVWGLERVRTAALRVRRTASSVGGYGEAQNQTRAASSSRPEHPGPD